MDHDDLIAKLEEEDRERWGRIPAQLRELARVIKDAHRKGYRFNPVLGHNTESPYGVTISSSRGHAVRWESNTIYTWAAWEEFKKRIDGR